ncbi:hypothetical protein HRR83_003315 [Exophiala dermatitidis]|uniref:Uncharacterized protein n=2 Tax=Exophiala dermatitidis TaxID=5970 RepID=H6BMU3_EXODN|nr:uncharacterized protein HMPREF1120_00338 [Exophiala dermatitidis NIH/UT8656]KAJ4518232.1 hypothetical protein HRR74_004527 [Exophiala dermatitidis]EHY52121.1 hypothetical protein HMPREF1120_00338 [Exophiala dermatitidis NIH/UT8656]KAJ4521130.1 hypothetical protein HRR73_003471 [Exophiala dermatitidis]KAJ4547718.1 hypothetical protein HRR76_000345 [Exophiala dermatitidis]KAJ4553655.1 hypothetical protein HRR77_002033 [Exophiala dermatitidis]
MQSYRIGTKLLVSSGNHQCHWLAVATGSHQAGKIHGTLSQRPEKLDNIRRSKSFNDNALLPLLDPARFNDNIKLLQARSCSWWSVRLLYTKVDVFVITYEHFISSTQTHRPNMSSQLLASIGKEQTRCRLCSRQPDPDDQLPSRLVQSSAE